MHTKRLLNENSENIRLVVTGRSGLLGHSVLPRKTSLVWSQEDSQIPLGLCQKLPKCGATSDKNIPK